MRKYVPGNLINRRDDPDVELVQHNAYADAEERSLQADRQDMAECGMMEAAGTGFANSTYEQAYKEDEGKDGARLEALQEKAQGEYEFSNPDFLEHIAEEPAGEMETRFAETRSGGEEDVGESEKWKGTGKETSLKGEEASTSCSQKGLVSLSEANEDTSSAEDDSPAIALLPQTTGEREAKFPKAEEGQEASLIGWDDINSQLLSQHHDVQEMHIRYGEEDAAL